MLLLVVVQRLPSSGSVANAHLYARKPLRKRFTLAPGECAIISAMVYW